MGFGQPDIPGTWVFRINEIRIQEIAAGGVLLQPGQIVNVPNNFQVITSLHNEGAPGAFYEGNPGTIRYRAERQEDDISFPLAATAFNVTSNVLAGVYDFNVTSAAFTSGAAGSGANLEEGTYVLTVIVTMDKPPEKQQVSAFEQTMIRVIT